MSTLRAYIRNSRRWVRGWREIRLRRNAAWRAAKRWRREHR